jgi:hypothetical protein
MVPRSCCAKTKEAPSMDKKRAERQLVKLSILTSRSDSVPRLSQAVTDGCEVLHAVHATYAGDDFPLTNPEGVRI